MRFSFDWLQKFVAVKDIDSVTSKLTLAGLELEEIENNKVIDLAIPPNRADCLGMFGIAREAAAAMGAELTLPKSKVVSPINQNQIKIDIQDTNKCVRYASRIINSINVAAKTPNYIQEALVNAGINLVNCIVDITNYVMLETGLPSHAYDFSKIDEKIVVRAARRGEKIDLLNNNTLDLDESCLIIADKNNVQALAGIMGSTYGMVTESTKDILLECAFFDSVNIRLTARDKATTSDSAFRFERGVDSTGQEQAIERLTELVCEVCGGEPGPTNIVGNTPKIHTIQLRKTRIKKVIGFEVPNENIINILSSLGFILSDNGDDYTVQVPTFRPDIQKEIDLIEEIVRLYGYDKIDSHMPSAPLSFMPIKSTEIKSEQIVDMMVARGYLETISYSFTSQLLADNFFEDALVLSNPISNDLSFMRQNLVASLSATAAYNQKRQNSHIRIFEIGLCFEDQTRKIAALISGPLLKDNWKNKEESNYYSLKADLEFLLNQTNSNAEIVPSKNPPKYYHPMQVADVIKNNEIIGVIGALHPNTCKNIDLDGIAYAFELDFQKLCTTSQVKFQEFSKYPIIRRDLAIVVEDKFYSKNIVDTIKEIKSEILVDVKVFDIYKGKGIENGKQSVAIGLTFSHNRRTLVDQEVEDECQAVIGVLKNKYCAQLR